MVEQSNYIDSIRAGKICLNNVPKKSKNHAICLAAVNVNGFDLYHVPKYMRSDTIYYSAIYQNPQALKFVEVEVLKEKYELVTMAISRVGRFFIWIVETIPEVIDYKICLCAVKASGANLKYVPERFIDNELVKIAAINDGSALNALYTSSSVTLKKSIETVVKEMPLKHIPDHLKDYDSCLAQVKRQGRQLKHVPFSLVDDKMIEASLNANPWAIEYVPVTFKDLSCVLKIIKSKLVPDGLFFHLEEELEFI